MKKTHKTRNNNRVNRRFGYPELFLIIIITTSTLAITLAILLQHFFNPEAVIRRTMTYITSDYYENYLYERTIGSSIPSEALRQYTDIGIAPVRLRQLLYNDNDKNIEHSSVFENLFCDKNATTVTYFPEEPFGKKDYRIEYNWHCEKIDLN